MPPHELSPLALPPTGSHVGFALAVERSVIAVIAVLDTGASITALFRQPAGTTLKIDVQREESVVKTQVELRDLLP